jgi:hypothetical protein
MELGLTVIRCRVMLKDEDVTQHNLIAKNFFTK